MLTPPAFCCSRGSAARMLTEFPRARAARSDLRRWGEEGPHVWHRLRAVGQNGRRCGRPGRGVLRATPPLPSRTGLRSSEAGRPCGRASSWLPQRSSAWPHSRAGPSISTGRRSSGPPSRSATTHGIPREQAAWRGLLRPCLRTAALRVRSRASRALPDPATVTAFRLGPAGHPPTALTCPAGGGGWKVPASPRPPTPFPAPAGAVSRTSPVPPPRPGSSQLPARSRCG